MLAVLAGGAGVYVLKRKSDEWKRKFDQTWEEQRTNPELRTAKATKMLHAERLPDGYYALGATSLPGVDTVMLGDQPPRPGGEPSGFDQRAFIYTRRLFQPGNNPVRAFVVGDTAIWFGPDPSPGTPVAKFDVNGTVADEKELRSFLSNFRVCGPRP